MLFFGNGPEIALAPYHSMKKRLERLDLDGKCGGAGKGVVHPSIQYDVEVDYDGLLVVLVIHSCVSSTSSVP